MVTDRGRRVTQPNRAPLSAQNRADHALRAATIAAGSASWRARGWRVTGSTSCPPFRALLGADSMAYAPRLARDRPVRRGPNRRSLAILGTTVSPALPRQLCAVVPGTGVGARALRPETHRGQLDVAGAPVELYVACGNLVHTPAASRAHWLPARSALDIPNIFDSCRKARLSLPPPTTNLSDPLRSQASNRRWITKAPR
jgi:hypothetical protein